MGSIYTSSHCKDSFFLPPVAIIGSVGNPARLGWCGLIEDAVVGLR